MRNVLRAIVVAAALSAAVESGAQGPSLAAAKDLYAAAEYTSALTMLTQLTDANPSTADRQNIELYRVLCLTALGNTAEATRGIETMLTADPLYRPDGADLPPRLRTAFTDARKRLLPTLVQQKYVVARTAYEQKEYLAAAEGFKFVLTSLGDPDLGAASSQPPLADLKVLASGFHDLSAKAAAPLDSAPPARIGPPLLSPSTGPSQSSAHSPPRIYGTDDTDVAPPQTVRQTVPAFPGRMAAGGAATIDIVINESGGVESVALVTSLNPQYDRMVLTAAKGWQYQPATLNGAPVKYRKRLQLTLVPDAPRR
jgi:TonB family protein